MVQPSLKGRKALVTGSAKRIGKSIALALAREGADLIVHYHLSKREALETAKEIQALGVRAEMLSADISDPIATRKLADQAIQLFGEIDIVVNNASIFYKTPLEKIHEKDFDTFFNTHDTGPFFLTRTIAEHLLKENKKGDVVNIADWSGQRPYGDYLPYCASKGALITMTRALARELAPRIRVNAILPGAILFPDDFSEAEKEQAIKKIPLGRAGTPEDIAKAVLFFLTDGRYMTGATLNVDGGRSIV